MTMSRFLRERARNPQLACEDKFVARMIMASLDDDSTTVANFKELVIEHNELAKAKDANHPSISSSGYLLWREIESFLHGNKVLVQEDVERKFEDTCYFWIGMSLDDFQTNFRAFCREFAAQPLTRTVALNGL